MNSFDIFIIVVVGFCLIRGVFRGLIKELSSIIGVLAGFYGAYTYYMKLAKLLSKWISDTGYLNILSFLLIFCSVFIIISVLGVVIKYLLNIAFLGWADRICGAGFGLMKGVLIVAVVLTTLTAFLPKGSPLIKKSHLAPHVAMISESMAKVASGDMKNQFAVKMSELKDVWRKK
jgi:membrane protein required for colicin V production